MRSPCPFIIRVRNPPALEPVTVEEVKTHTRVNGTDQDSVIAQWIRTGREIAEVYQRRAYVEQTLELSLDSFASSPIRLPRSPVMEVKQIKYYTVDNTEVVIYDADSPVGTEDQYLVDLDSEPARILPAHGYTWPVAALRELNAVKVVYTAGYGPTVDSTPGRVKDAIMLYCAWRFENRVAETNTVPHQFYALLDQDRMYL